MQLNTEAETLALGAAVAKPLSLPCVIHLVGDLGSGKTTFARGFINALGYEDRVTSPTFSLVESYELDNLMVYHFDLYRLKDSQELEFIGIRDVVSEPSTAILIEWPERGGVSTPPADLVIKLVHHEDRREAQLEAETTLGQSIIDKL